MCEKRQTLGEMDTCLLWEEMRFFGKDSKTGILGCSEGDECQKTLNGGWLSNDKNPDVAKIFY